MRVFYTTDTCPFSDDELKAGFHGLPDIFKSKEQVTIPYTAEDVSAPMRYDELNALVADHLHSFIEKLPVTTSLGIIFITDMKIIAHSGAHDFASNPELPDEYMCRGLTTPFTIAVISIEGLTHTQAHRNYLHEMGHFYGLKHCSDLDCLMYHFDHEDMTVLDNTSGLCSKCQTKIIENLVI